MTPADLDELCPDWREREAFLSGPGEMLDAHGRALGRATATRERLHMERFQPKLGLGEEGEGGAIVFVDERQGGRVRRRARRSSSPARRPGLELPFGCREGICHTCIGKLCSGRVRDLRNGKVTRLGGRDGPDLHQRARGPIEIDAMKTEEERRDHRPTIESPLARLTRRADRGARARVRRDPRRGLRRPRRPRPPLHRQHDRDAPPPRRAGARAAARLALQARLDRRDAPPTRRPRSSRTWRSATTSCTASGTG